MNFKQFFLFFIFILISSCGVKGPPKAPAGTATPSFISPYLNEGKSTAKEDDKKKTEEDAASKVTK